VHACEGSVLAPRQVAPLYGMRHQIDWLQQSGDLYSTYSAVRLLYRLGGRSGCDVGDLKESKVSS
jgi:hypothetical protein